MNTLREQLTKADSACQNEEWEIAHDLIKELLRSTYPDDDPMSPNFKTAHPS